MMVSPRPVVGKEEPDARELQEVAVKRPRAGGEVGRRGQSTAKSRGRIRRGAGLHGFRRVSR